MAVTSRITGRRGGQLAAPDRRRVRRRLVTVSVIAICAITVLLAVPALRPVVREIADMNPWLVAAAVALELGSCVSFVIVFRLFFAPVPVTATRELAWSQMGSGALLPGGGVGSLAVGGWLLHLTGMPTRQIVQRSSGLFFLTSAVNVVTLSAAGLLLLLGIADGAHDALRAGLPTVAGVGACGLALGLPALTRRISGAHPRAAWLDDISSGIPAARHALARPSWRLVGALGYLLLYIAVLWTAFAAVGPLLPLAPLVLAYLGRLPRQRDPGPRRHRRPRRRPCRCPGAVRIARHSRCRRGSRVPRHRVLDSDLGGTAGYVRLRRRLNVGDGLPVTPGGTRLEPAIVLTRGVREPGGGGDEFGVAGREDTVR